ncbi:MAG: hypothetical protein ACRECV_15790 [Xanthobacteraceae bacterium]
MVADAVLWVISGVAVTFIWFGCRMTKRAPKAVEQRPQATMDRAA